MVLPILTQDPQMLSNWELPEIHLTKVSDIKRREDKLKDLA